MLESPTLIRFWMALIALAVICMPINREHLHLCFDGNESAASVHVMEDGPHHVDEGLDASHHDADVSLAGAALVKKLDGALDLPALVMAAVLLFRVPVAAPVRIPHDDPALAVAVRIIRLLPPSQAPPV